DSTRSTRCSSATHRPPAWRDRRARTASIHAMCYCDLFQIVFGNTLAMQHTFDRAPEDLGNAIHLEHVNVTIPCQPLPPLFYVAGLGLTRDPYLMVSDNNMWVNVGRSQFHLPADKPQVLRGHTGLVIAGRAALLDRLASVRKKLEGTKFAFAEHNDYVEATCPYANHVSSSHPHIHPSH